MYSKCYILYTQRSSKKHPCVDAFRNYWTLRQMKTMALKTQRWWHGCRWDHIGRGDDPTPLEKDMESEEIGLHF